MYYCLFEIPTFLQIRSFQTAYIFWDFLLNFLVHKIWEFQKQKTFYSLAYFYTYLGKCIEASLHLFKSPHHIKIKSKNFPFFFMKLLVACQIFPILIAYVGYSNIFRKWAKSMHYIEEGNANVHKQQKYWKEQVTVIHFLMKTTTDFL